jgi:hypothetical protein
MSRDRQQLFENTPPHVSPFSSRMTLGYRRVNSLMNRGRLLLQGNAVDQIEAAKYFKLAANQNVTEG